MSTPPVAKPVVTGVPEIDTLPDFNGNSLRLISPFRYIQHRIVSDTSKDGRPYQRYVVVGAPVANPNVKFKTVMFKGQYDEIRAILFLNKDSAINTTLEKVGNRTNSHFSGVLPP